MTQPDRIGQVLSGRYKIESLIGEGGMGAVYLAEHVLMRKKLALKLLHPQMAKNDEVLARFRREAEAAAKVEHPNIVAATDFGQTDDGAFFLVLEYVDGTTLRRKLVEAPFPASRALHIARQVALALDRAHEAGIVHRDLKPENVMLVTKGDDPDFAKVLDFGVARIDQPSGEGGGPLLTQAGTVMGTPSYMAPEQAVADRVTHRADLYALGILIYEMLTGVVPFEGDMLELLTKHVTAPVPLMGVRNPAVTVPEAIEGVVRKLLEKDAANRYASGKEVVAAIDQAAADSGVELRGTPPISERKIAILTGEAPSPVEPTRKLDAKDTSAVLARVRPYKAKALELVKRADALASEVAARFSAPKAAVIGIAGAVALVPVLLLVTILVARRGDASPAKPGDSTVAKLLGGGGVSADDIRAAAAKGTPALEELLAKHPGDPAIGRELALAYDTAGRSADALRVVKGMVDADAGAVPRELVRVVIHAAPKLETADEAFRLLEGPLGADGVDGLMELAESDPPSTSARAKKSLTKPSVRASASPAAGFALELSTAATCEERHSLLVKSGASADARALPPLRALEVKSGCGKRRRFDCNPCLRKDDALAKALEAAGQSR